MSGRDSGYRGTMREPTSTYRLQVNQRFTLHDAAATLPYLHDLGADWLYLSPLLKAEPGSDHGYDVVDHTLVDPARGGAEGLAAVSAEAHRLGMGVLVDIVPNHVGVATPRENAWWWDVLARGPASEHAGAFDIDWEAGNGRLRIPVVGDDDLVDGGRIANLSVVENELRYHGHRFPIRSECSASSVRADRTEPDEVHGRQHYELVSWRLADTGLNYRRFFAVNTLAGVRVEDRRVFDDSHVDIRRWFGKGLVDGLRVDHPDGLRDPAAYLEDLRDLTGGAYVLVEKILEPGEALSPSWATDGTTGYDALGLVDRVLTDPAGQEPLTALEARLRGGPLDWRDLVHGTKRAVADGILGSEVRRVVREVVAGGGLATGADGPSHDAGLVDAVAELLACFPVYRSYLPQGRAHLDAAFADARRRRADLAPALDALEPVLADPDQPAAQRFQQTSGAVMAKGVEDCAFYRTSRLTSLTEVGADPSEWSLTVEEFHAAMAVRQREWPRAMTTTSTHDTKRGEDVRARIAVLAEVPRLWADALDRLLALAPIPDPSFGNLVWQAVLGAWPASPERLHGYAEKAMREAGDRTTWTEPDVTYEAAVHAAVDAAFDRPEVGALLDELLLEVAGPGWSNAVSAKAIALTMPGVPDVFQGSELWEQSLVDPDNRRPVDFEVRREVLQRVLAGERPVLTPHSDEPGHAKLLVTQAALTLRRNQPHRFATYTPLAARGEAADHVLGFDRGGALTVATRLPVGLMARGWGETVLPLPDGTWADLLTGREYTGDAPLHRLLADYPVALLISTGAIDGPTDFPADFPADTRGPA
jgi:(1->4)-alpha-D-glucan 1-alpha-D-glucosylmutase